MKITALKLQKNRQRVNVYVDGEFALGLAKILAGWLQVGQEITPEQLAELEGADALEVAYQRALNYLSYRRRSEAEIRQHLVKSVEQPEIIEAVIDRLRDAGLVDDQAFAEAWITNRIDFRPRGRRALRFELRAKKVPDEIIDEALRDLDEEDLAYQAAQTRSQRLAGLDWALYYRKLSGFLYRRGFGSEAVSNAIRRTWDERNGDIDG